MVKHVQRRDRVKVLLAGACLDFRAENSPFLPEDEWLRAERAPWHEDTPYQPWAAILLSAETALPLFLLLRYPRVSTPPA